MKIFILICLLILNNFKAEGQSKLKFNSIYVFDNKTDTIIKDYSLFQEFQKLIPGLNSLQNDSLNFAPMPGSNFTESLVFYEHDGGSRANSMFFDVNKHLYDHENAHQLKDPNNYIQLVTIKEDSILFVYGDYIFGVATWYSGKIYSDSLVLKRRTTFKGDDIHEVGEEIPRTYTIINPKDIFKKE
jgi:hypothetical protein